MRPKEIKSKDFLEVMKYALEKSKELTDLVPASLQEKLELVSLQEVRIRHTRKCRVFRTWFCTDVK